MVAANEHETSNIKGVKEPPPALAPLGLLEEPSDPPALAGLPLRSVATAFEMHSEGGGGYLCTEAK